MGNTPGKEFYCGYVLLKDTLKAFLNLHRLQNSIILHACIHHRILILTCASTVGRKLREKQENLSKDSIFSDALSLVSRQDYGSGRIDFHHCFGSVNGNFS